MKKCDFHNFSAIQINMIFIVRDAINKKYSHVIFVQIITKNGDAEE
jgi:hypothetical protein